MNSIRPVPLAVAMASLLVLGASMAQTPATSPGTTPMTTMPQTPLAPMTSGTIPMTAALTGANEVPPVASPATGMVEATYTASGSLLAWRITYEGLTGPVTGAHFHGPASAGQNAGIALPLAGSMASPITGSATLTPAQVADLTAGRWYFNLHTAANPGGEIRGQVGMRP